MFRMSSWVRSASRSEKRWFRGSSVTAILFCLPSIFAQRGLPGGGGGRSVILTSGEIERVLNQSRSFSHDGDTPRARALLDELLDKVPAHGGVLAEIARLESNEGRLVRATALFRRALFHDPGLAIRTELARCLLAQGRSGEALRYLGNGSPETAILRARALLEQGRVEDAERSLNLIVDESGVENLSEAYELAVLHAHLNAIRGRLGDASNRYREAIALDPAQTDARLGLGLVLLRSARYEAALEYLEPVLEHVLPPRIELVALDAVADVYEALGKPDLAVEALERSLRLAPENSNRFRRLSILSGATSDPVTASNYLRASQVLGKEGLESVRTSGDAPTGDRIGTFMGFRPGDQDGTIDRVPSRDGPVSPIDRRGYAGQLRFIDVALDSGLSFHHSCGFPLLNWPQLMGPGVIVLDFDRDGYDDILLVSSGPMAGGRQSPGYDASPMLFRNLGDGRFEKTSNGSLIDLQGRFLGGAAADLNNDGYPDLVLTGWGERVTLLNCGDGTFIRQWAIPVPHSNLLGSGVAIGDFDRDRYLDIYFTNYSLVGPQDLQARPAIDSPRGGSRLAGLDGLQPHRFQGASNVLLRNEGGFRFVDVTHQSNSALDERGDERSFQAVMVDLNLDGWIDIFVATDAARSGLLIGGESLVFTECAKSYWIDDARGNMGVAVGDPDGDGDPDIVITHWVNQATGLYLNQFPRPWFSDRAIPQGVMKSDPEQVGWGVHLQDFDLDGTLDLLILDGHIVADRYDPLTYTSTALNLPGPQAPQFFSGTGGRFLDVSTQAGAELLATSARGSAVLDFDRDGDLDVVVAANSRCAQLLRADTTEGHWIRVDLEGTVSNRDGVGARVIVERGRGERLTRWLISGSGYLSSETQSVHFGLGASPGLVTLSVDWPSGIRTVMTDMKPDREYRIVESPGSSIDSTP